MVYWYRVVKEYVACTYVHSKPSSNLNFCLLLAFHTEASLLRQADGGPDPIWGGKVI